MKKPFIIKIKTLTLSIIFLKIHFVFGSLKIDSLPQFTIKIIPHTFWIDYDPHLEVAFEHFLNPKSSFQVNLGYWNNLNSKSANTYEIKLIRLNYRNFFRKFSEKKPGRGYFNTELMYKNVIEPNSLMAMDNNNPNPYFTKFKVNVLALNLLVGREYVSKDYFPAFDMFFGLGVRASYNFNEYVPPGYFSHNEFAGMFSRSPGFSIFPSINAGIGKWKK